MYNLRHLLPSQSPLYHKIYQFEHTFPIYPLKLLPSFAYYTPYRRDLATSKRYNRDLNYSMLKNLKICQNQIFYRTLFSKIGFVNLYNDQQSLDILNYGNRLNFSSSSSSELDPTYAMNSPGSDSNDISCV